MFTILYLLIKESVDCDFIKSSTLVLLTGGGVVIGATVVTGGVCETGGGGGATGVGVFGVVDGATVVIGFDVVGVIFRAWVVGSLIFVFLSVSD